MRSKQARSARFQRCLRAALITLLVGLLGYGLPPTPSHAQPDTTRWTPEVAMQYDQITDTEIARHRRMAAQ